ncbi:MAG: ABC transporter permease [Bryobacteraceae bacterium]|nr:ABC transporter permease [Bryobacteraceae bacterium]
MQDLRFAVRQLARNPDFAAIAILALGLGIGANTAIFSVFDTVLLGRLPFADPDRLVMVWEDAAHLGFPRNTPAVANWLDWSKRNTVFTGIGAIRGASRNLTGEGAPENLVGSGMTANTWEVLGAKPLLGRMFAEEEDRKAAPVVVISHGLWQRRFGGDVRVLGRKILLSDQPYEVIGVMTADFAFPERLNDIWIPASFTPNDFANRGAHFLTCVARLKPDATLERAQAEMSGIARQLEREYPQSNRKIGVTLVPLREQIAGDLRLALTVLLMAAGAVLLIACANLANLLLARASGRRQEMAVRAALGASRMRIVRQVLAESLLLAGLGALLGLVFARVGMIVLEKLIPSGLAATALRLDWRVLGFALIASILTGILFGLAPAIASARTNLHGTIRQGDRGAAGARRNWLRDALVISQVALALVLLSGAGLMIQTLRNLEAVDIGMRKDHLLTMSTFLANGRYPDHAKRHAFYTLVLDNVKAVPGVVAAAYTSALPLTTPGNTSGYRIEGQSPAEALLAGQDALFRVVTPEFLETIRGRLKEGRWFTNDDRNSTLPVMVINESFAIRHWPGQSAVGKRFSVGYRGGTPDTPRWLTVVGVVKEIRERGIDIALKSAMYMPSAQSELYWPRPADLVVRTSVEPESVAGAVQQAIWSVDKDQPVSRLRTMQEVSDRQLAARSQQATLLGAFAGLALLLAAIGIYGVLSYAVAQRRKEIGVRMSLGARPSDVLTMVLGRGVSLALVGLAIGIVASLALGGLVKSMLFGVAPQDPITLVSVSAALLLVAALACAIPARRAARVDPAIALRAE